MNRWALSLLFVGFCACSSKNSLSGSVSQVYPLDFQTVTANIDSSVVTINYLKGASTTTGYTLKVVLDLTGLPLVANQSIDLTQPAANGLPRGTFEQILTDDIALPFSIASISFSELPVAGKEVSGHFAATFTDPSGRDLQGDFDVAKVAQLSP